MPTSISPGTVTLTSSTETTVGSAQTTDGNYVFVFSLANMANGQELEVRVKMKVIAGGTAIVFYYGFYAHVQAEPGVVSIPLPSTEYWEATFKKTAGGDLAIECRIDLI